MRETLFSLRKAWIGIGVLSFFVNLLMLTGPLYMLQIYDRVISSRSMSTLVALTALMVIMYAFMGMMDFLRSRLLVRIGNYTEKNLDERTFHIWMKQGLLGPAAAKRKPLSDLATIKKFLTGTAPITLFDIPWTPVYIAVIFMFHWWLGVFAVFGVLIILTMAIIAEVTTRKTQESAQSEIGNSDSFSEKCHANAETVMSMGMGEDLARRWSSLKNDGLQKDLAASDISGGASAFSKSFRMFMQSSILGLGAMLVIQQVMSPGAMIAGSLILGRALSPIQMVIGHWRGFNQARGAYKRLNIFYDMTAEDEQMVPLPAPTGYVSVENMSAAPPGAKRATLKGIRFKIQPGDCLCVLGPSAAGKSTLARLLVGAWRPQLGAVRLDGATLDQWSSQNLGHHIGYLPQKIDLFDGTVGENIARFRQDAHPSAVVEAAQMTGVHELIVGLPDGYNTRIGEGGAVLSVGQVQRIALARAAYGNPCLMVLDEPNSNLDAQGDEALTLAIQNMRQRGQTIIVITHRQSVMDAANKVLILRNGSQVKFGAKEDILGTQDNDAQLGATSARPSNSRGNFVPATSQSLHANPYATPNRGAA